MTRLPDRTHLWRVGGAESKGGVKAMTSDERTGGPHGPPVAYRVGWGADSIYLDRRRSLCETSKRPAPSIVIMVGSGTPPVVSTSPVVVVEVLVVVLVVP